MASPDVMTLVVVDDDDDVRTALTRLLRAMGHRVLGFASAEAFEAGDASFDCAIIDMRLPGLSGLELCERLRQRAVPSAVVLITGDAVRLAGDMSRAADTPVVNKPFDEATLVAAIATATAMASAGHADH